VKQWINEGIFKTWTDAQKRLWESLCAAVPFQPPAGIETWRETYLKNLRTWETTVKKTLLQEEDWVKQWVHQIAQEKGTPEMMNAWVLQMEDVLQRWIQTQNQWWDDYFTILRQGELVAAPEAARINPASVIPKPTVVAEPVAEPDPIVTAEPAAVAVPEPVVIVEPEPAAVAVPEPVVIVEPEPAAVAVPVVVAEPVIKVAAPTPFQPDDLKLISGIGQTLEKKLRKQGISSYRQLGTLNDADIARLEAAMKSVGRIRRENWVGQAKTLHFHKYQESL
jgi:predicted flap endonuclease-1-like 5' DNA nuclease